MVFFIDVTIFGYTLASNIALIERNVAFSAFYFGLLLKLVIGNINARDENTALLDIFMGTGFVALFKGNFTYITGPIKALLKLEGPVFSFIVVSIAALFFPMIAPDLVDLESLRSFLFLALTTGYSVDLVAAQFIEIFSGIRKYSSQLNAVLAPAGGENA